MTRRILGIDPGLRITGYGAIECDGAAIELLDIGMIRSLGQNGGDDAALPRHLQAFFDAQALDARDHSVKPSPLSSPMGASPSPGT